MPLNSRFQNDLTYYIKDKLSREIPNIYIEIISLGAISPIVTCAMIDNIIKDDYDLFITFNSLTALIAKERLNKSGKEVPFLFTGTAYPLEYDLIHSFKHPGGLCTGVINSIQDISSYVNFFTECFPDMDKVILPCEGNHSDFHRNLAREKSLSLKTKYFYDLFPEMVEAFKESGKQCDLLINDDMNELLFLLQDEMAGYGAVLTMEGSRVNSWAKGIGQKCIENNKILFSGWLDPIIKGYSPIGYGLDYSYLKNLLVDQAKAILVDGKHPSEIPTIRLTTERYPAINTETLSRLTIDKKHVLNVADKWKAKIF